MEHSSLPPAGPAEPTLADLAAMAKLISQLLLTLDVAARARGAPPPFEVRTVSWALLYWSFEIKRADGERKSTR